MKLFGEEAVSDYEGTLAGEDFSEYLDIVPGVFVFLGCRNPDVDAVYPQHSGYYTVDESVLKNGAALAANMPSIFWQNNAGRTQARNPTNRDGIY